MSTSYDTNKKRKRLSDLNSLINDTSICTKDGCFAIAKFNFPREKKRLYCAKHKKEEMINRNCKKK